MKTLPEDVCRRNAAILLEPLPPIQPKLVIEAEAPRDMIVGGSKLLYCFDNSLEALKARGYERHLRPVEAFSLLEKNLEGKLSEEEQEIAEDILAPWGEWLSLAIRWEGKTLYCYEDPENLFWDAQKKCYTITGGKLRYSAQKSFVIEPPISKCSFIELGRLPSELQRYVYGCTWEELPEDMKGEVFLAGVFFPQEENILWPACSSDFFMSRFAISYPGSRHMASRGIRKE